MRPSSTAAIAGSASGAMRTYHWSVSHGSSTAPLRSPRGTVSVCGSIFSSRPGGLEVGDDALARLEAVEPAIRAGTASLSAASAVKMLIIGSPWRLPIS